MGVEITWKVPVRHTGSHWPLGHGRLQPSGKESPRGRPAIRSPHPHPRGLFNRWGVRPVCSWIHPTGLRVWPLCSYFLSSFQDSKETSKMKIERSC